MIFQCHLGTSPERPSETPRRAAVHGPSSLTARPAPMPSSSALHIRLGAVRFLTGRIHVREEIMKRTGRCCAYVLALISVASPSLFGPKQPFSLILRGPKEPVKT